LVDLGVIDRIEASIGPIARMKEGQQVHASEQSVHRPAQQNVHSAQCAAESVGIDDQLDLILHAVELP
jgi:hypothetical protein